MQRQLGEHGILVIIFDEAGNPAACSGELPFRGDYSIEEGKKERSDVGEW